MTDLMQPRYKVIADYPGCNSEVGHVFISDIGEYFDKFKANFRKLKWYEHRGLNEMPKYVKVTKIGSHTYPIGTIREVTAWERSCNNESWLCDLFPEYVRVSHLEPATEEEYNQYTQTKKI
jgi:hypothetical protein